MIKFEHVKKSFKDTVVINDMNLHVKKGEFIVLIGESGCGKTTTMKMINRLIEPTGGTIYVNGQDILKMNPIELRRNIGYVIQRVGLFPHMTVGENIELVPLLKQWPKEKRDERAKELLDLVGLPAKEYFQRYPNELSGGQRQRIGIARALAVNPDVILMDEPFSALDPITREQLQDEMIRLQQELEKTIVLVSHDMDEAIKLADKIAVMSEGEVIQFDSPEEILTNPVNEFVANFVGKDRLWQRPEMLLAKDVMHKKYARILPKRHLAEAIERMKERGSEFIIVINQMGQYEGYLTSKDIHGKGKKTTISEIIKKDIDPMAEDIIISDVIDVIKSRHLPFVPVIDENRVVTGAITKSSVLNVISEHLTTD